uniref:Uncharacterized protein n=1 Tax=Euplotes harpa TaxID=151035 RepID=A0A7S3J3H8_9SPIT|mmetsp:Transcript_14832/g.17164  ORF Transcript_14832/g.17164 Transcript_14832/m.17164 type:complete len:167 (+) Transcript_14832:31-531(+)|eukprot:CAMPEP_0168329624 /NCGR_PEP_ID=MMETSP0213-20121227/7221_1 /TAXON_ID=151035 /ORGANISM="Euplotes harpa, Strain FSP1.4" /LENGTH=166 /DNA_ID=CAMNT_0008332989 /DNA_START=29 /DNA_END=529 /DNA_ORIENTATION=+
MEKYKKHVNYKMYLNTKHTVDLRPSLDDAKDRFQNDSVEENIDSFPNKLKVYTTPQKKMRSRPLPHKGDESYQKEEKDVNKRMSYQPEDIGKDFNNEKTSIALSEKEKELEDMQNQFLSKIDERTKKESQLKELNTIITNLQAKLRDKTQENRELRDKINFLLQIQ